MTRDMTKTDATFENTWSRYPFAPLVALALMLASRVRTVAKPAAKSGAGPVFQ